ncbi:GNAT family N-acetyltransferase [Candidatus Omnitrophota bacterium]
MKKIKKGYVLIVVFLTISTIVLSPGMLYSSSFIRESLRIQMNTQKTIDRLDEAIVFMGVLKKSGKNISVFKLDNSNFERYREDIIDIALTLPDKLPMLHIENYIEEYNKASDIGIVRDKGSVVAYVAIADGKVAGYVMGVISKKTFFSFTRGTSKEYEGMGIGNALLWITAQELKKRKIPAISASVNSMSDTSLAEFLKHRGFSNKTGRTIFEGRTLSVIEKTQKIMLKQI